MTNGTAAGTLSAGRDIVPFVTGRTRFPVKILYQRVCFRGDKGRQGDSIPIAAILGDTYRVQSCPLISPPVGAFGTRPRGRSLAHHRLEDAPHLEPKCATAFVKEFPRQFRTRPLWERTSAGFLLPGRSGGADGLTGIRVQICSGTVVSFGGCRVPQKSNGRGSSLRDGLRRRSLKNLIAIYFVSAPPNSSGVLLRSGHTRVDAVTRGLFPTLRHSFRR
jgi:hypothetical protein